MADISEIKLDEQQSTLLQIIYTSDTTAEKATEQLGISMEELENIVNSLIDKNILQQSGEAEVELTDEGKLYFEEHVKSSSEETKES